MLNLFLFFVKLQSGELTREIISLHWGVGELMLPVYISILSDEPFAFFMFLFFSFVQTMRSKVWGLIIYLTCFNVSLPPFPEVEKK